MAESMQIPVPALRLRKWILDTVARIAHIHSEELQPEVLIREELGIDSLKAMEIVATCEKEMRITIDERQLFDIRTVGDFLDLLEGIYQDK